MKTILKVFLLLIIFSQAHAQSRFKIGLGSGAMFPEFRISTAEKIGMTTQVNFEYLMTDMFSVFLSAGYSDKSYDNNSIANIYFANFNLGGKYYFYSGEKLKTYVALELGKAWGKWYSGMYYPSSFVQAEDKLDFIDVFNDRPGMFFNDLITVADLGLSYKFMDRVEADLSVGKEMTSSPTLPFFRILAGLSIDL